MSENHDPEKPNQQSIARNEEKQNSEPYEKTNETDLDPPLDALVSRNYQELRSLMERDDAWVELTGHEDPDPVVAIDDYTAFSEHYRISVIEGFEPAAYCEYDKGELRFRTVPAPNGQPDLSIETWRLDTSSYSKDREFPKELERYVTLIGFVALGYRTPKVEDLLEAVKSKSHLPRESEYRALLRAYVEWALESQEDWRHLASVTKKEYQDSNSLTKHMFLYLYSEVLRLAAPFFVLRHREIFPWDDRLMFQIRSLDDHLEKLLILSLGDRHPCEGQNAKIEEMLGFISSVCQKLEFLRTEFTSETHDEVCESTPTGDVGGAVDGKSEPTSEGQQPVSAERSVSLNDDCFCVLMALYEINQPQGRSFIRSKCQELGFGDCTEDVVTRYCSTKYLKKEMLAERCGSGWVITEMGRIFAKNDLRFSEDYRYPGYDPRISSPDSRSSTS